MADRKQDQAKVEQGPATGSAEQAKVSGAKLASDDKALAGGRPDGPIVTSDPKREADKTSYPVPNDAQLEDPPVRTARADVPIAVSLATGAGQHNPPDPEKYTPDGRPRDLAGSDDE